MRILPVLPALLLAASGLAAQQPTPSAELRLAPGDAIQILIWREEDLSGEFLIDPEGRVVIPMLGERVVAGRAWEEVRQTLIAEFNRELRNPSIELTPLRRVYVLGEVNEPGLYSVDPAVSLAGAVASAGGATSQGDLRRIRVVRDGAVVLDGLAAEAGMAAVGIRSGDQIFVGRRGWVERNSTFLVTAALSLTSVIVAVVR